MKHQNSIKIIYLIIFILASCQEADSSKTMDKAVELRLKAVKEMEQAILSLRPILNVEARRYFSYTENNDHNNDSIEEDSVMRTSIIHNPDLAGKLGAQLADVLLSRQINSDTIMKALEGFAKHYPEFSYVYYLQAGLKQRENQPKAAILLLNKAIEQNPAIAEYHLKKGQILEEANNLDSALYSYDEALVLLDQKWHTYWRKAWLYQKLKQPQAVVQSYTKAIREVESYADKLKMNGKSEEFNQWGALGAAFRGGIDEEIASSYFLRGSFFATIKQLDKACPDWKKSLELGNLAAVSSLKEYCKE